jgi:aspartate-semialdehyde dehydrogenase
MGYRVAVVGATGNVGREMLQILAERNFPADDVVALASARSAGKQTSFGENTVLKVQDLAKFDFKGIDIVLSSPGAKVSAEHSPRAAKAGAVVIDNTSYWRMDPDVPLVVPGSTLRRSPATRRAASSPIPTARPSRWWWP